MDPRLRALRTIIKAIFPELTGYHCPIRARVVAVHEAGGPMSERTPRHSVDVQPLRPDWSVDPERPVIPDVEIPIHWAGPRRGVYCLPRVGAIVRVAWYYGDAAHPFVDAVLGTGYECPEHPIDCYIIQHSDGTRIILGPGHIVLVQGAEKVVIDAPRVELVDGAGHPLTFADVLKTWADNHVHPYGTGTTGPPTAPLEGHDSQVVFTG